jgi:glutathione S-transferase
MLETPEPARGEDPMALTLYTNPQSRGRIARWMCEELREAAGIDYDAVVLDYGTTMKAPEYLAVNPMGKVPAVVHDRTVVTEAAAICAYLADAFPTAGLAPAVRDPARGPYYRWMFFAAGPLEQAVINRTLGVTQDADRSRMVGYGSYETAVGALEGWLAGHDYVTGRRFTAADVYVGAAVSWGLAFGTLPKSAAFEDYAGRVMARPAAQRAAAIDEALIAKG